MKVTLNQRIIFSKADQLSGYGDVLSREVKDIFSEQPSLFMHDVFRTVHCELDEVASPNPVKGRYYTSEQVKNKWIDFYILIETQIKRFCRFLSTTPPLLWRFFSWLFIQKLKMKLNYFDQSEPEHFHDFIFEDDKAVAFEIPPNDFKAEEGEFENNEVCPALHNLKIINLGHASQLIELAGMKVMIDPVFADLTKFLYPSMTKPFVEETPQVPAVDVILISHNHRDHVDEGTLKTYLKMLEEHQQEQPKLLVPMGDKSLFEKLGFQTVEEFKWHETEIHEKDGQHVTFCSVPSNHRSGRGPFDLHKSLVTGWVMKAEKSPHVVYDAGDTARLSDARILALATNIYQVSQDIDDLKQLKITQLIPGGPNYTRKDMAPTHQSFLDSIVSCFRLAIALEKVSQAAGQDIKAVVWLSNLTNVVMHHNKFELGPDRFNENVFIRDRLLSYLAMAPQTRLEHEEKQKRKTQRMSLFHRRKDFILQGVSELLELGEEIWGYGENSEKLISFIKSRYHFPKINETLSEDRLHSDDVTAYLPDTRVRCYVANISIKMPFNKACQNVQKKMQHCHYAVMKYGEAFYYFDKKHKEIKRLGQLKLYSGKNEKLEKLSQCFDSIAVGTIKIAHDSDTLDAIGALLPRHQSRKGEKFVESLPQPGLNNYGSHILQ